MVLRFGMKLGYKSPNAFILSENLASALEDSTIIKKKLQWGLGFRPRNTSTLAQLPVHLLFLGLDSKA